MTGIAGSHKPALPSRFRPLASPTRLNGFRAAGEGLARQLANAGSHTTRPYWQAAPKGP